MKKCIKCQMEIEDEAQFCPECGASQTVVPAAPQPPVQPMMTPAAPRQPMAPAMQPPAEADTAQLANQLSSHLLNKLSSVMRWEKLGYIGMGMAAISVALPLVSVSLLSMVTSMLNISQLLSFAVLALCCFAAYYFSEEKYNISLSVGVGFLVTFGVAYYKLHAAVVDAGTKLKDLSALKMLPPDAVGLLQLMQGFTDKLVGVGIGVYFLLAGSLIFIVASAACRLGRKNAAIDIGSIFGECKLALTEMAEIGSQKLPAYVITILTVAILIFIAMNIEIFTVKLSTLL